MCFTLVSCGLPWSVLPLRQTLHRHRVGRTERPVMPSTNQRDPYEILGISRDASAEQIKSAYRKAALRWPPDRNPDVKPEAEENFRQASDAYSVLSDPQKRLVYDRFGHAGLNSRGFEATGFNSTIFDEFHDILGDLFGVDDVFG